LTFSNAAVKLVEAMSNARSTHFAAALGMQILLAEACA
jgi:hypothetical protein